LPNGVLVQILRASNEAELPLFKEFVYQHPHGFFQLSQDPTACGIEDGVLVLVLRCIPKPKMRIGRVPRAPLMRIDEEASMQNQDWHLALSRSPSSDTLSTVSSVILVPSLGGDSAFDGELSPRSAQSSAQSFSMSQSGPHCFMPFTLFKMATVGTRVPASDLKIGSRIMAADGVTVLEVSSVVPNKAREVLQLEAGEAKLTVTGTHRMLVPHRGDSGKASEVPAGRLNVGDAILCKTHDGASIAQELTSVLVMVGEEDIDVLQIAFVPDVPVAVFEEPSMSLLSKGFRKKKTRRTYKQKAGRDGTDSIPDTAAGDYSD